jgi:gluconolactonase
MFGWKDVLGGLLVVAGLSATCRATDLKDLVAEDAAPVKVVGDCKFTEGPAYSPRGFLLFSDIPNSRIVRLNQDGTTSDFLNPSGKANGLAFDAAGHLYACQGGSRRVVKIAIQDGKVEPLCSTYDGQPLNSPNDLALDGRGGLYFTDPRYGSDTKIDQPCMGVYYIDSRGKTTRVIDTLQRPNGILVSIDGKSLYVAEPNQRQLFKYEITGAGKIESGTPIFTGDEQLDGHGPDGMCLDQQGRLYATYKGIVVLEDDGSLIGRIPTPEPPANCKFGGGDGKTLYITARTSLYSLAMKVSGQPLFESGPRPAAQASRQNYFRGPARLTQDKPESGDAETREVEIKAIKLKIPTSWKEEKPSNTLRLTQFKIPGDKDTDRTELVISSFPGGGGGVDMNFKRWLDQFVAEGRQVKMTSGSSPLGVYYICDITGSYIEGSGRPFAEKKAGPPKPNYQSMSVVLKTPDDEYFFLRMTGPEKTVKSAADAFRKSFGADAANEKEYTMKK